MIFEGTFLIIKRSSSILRERWDPPLGLRRWRCLTVWSKYLISLTDFGRLWLKCNHSLLMFVLFSIFIHFYQNMIGTNNNKTMNAYGPFLCSNFIIINYVYLCIYYLNTFLSSCITCLFIHIGSPKDLQENCFNLLHLTYF